MSSISFVTSSPALDDLNADAAKNPQVVAQLVRGFQNTQIGIVLGPEDARDSSCRGVLAATANLLVRLFPNLLLHAPYECDLPPALVLPGKLDEQVAAHCLRVNKAGSCEVSDFGRVQEADILIVVGSSDIQHKRLLRVDASGWIAFASTAGDMSPWTTSRQAHPCTPLAAAAIATGLIVRPILENHATPPATVTLNLYDYTDRSSGPNPETPDYVAIDKVPLVGVGSIGSAFVYALLSAPRLVGELILIDNEALVTKNLARYVLMEDHDRDRPKTDWAAQLLSSRHLDLRVEALQMNVAQWARSLGPADQIRLLISAPDTYDARREAADTLPLVAVVASIDGSEASVNHCHFANTLCAYCPTLPVAGTQKREDLWQQLTGLRRDRILNLVFPDAQTGQRNALEDADLRVIERSGNYPESSLSRWRGRLIEDLMEEERGRLYAEIEVVDRESGHPPIRIALGFVSAFAGAIAACEMLKELIPDQHSAGGTYKSSDSTSYAGEGCD